MQREGEYKSPTGHGRGYFAKYARAMALGFKNAAVRRRIAKRQSAGTVPLGVAYRLECRSDRFVLNARVAVVG